MGQGLGSGLAGWFWPRVFHEAAVMMLARAAGGSPKVWLDLADLHPRQRTHSASGSSLRPSLAPLLTFSRRGVGPSTGVLECSQNMAAAFLRASWSKRDGREEFAMPFCDCVVSEVTSFYFWYIRLGGSPLAQPTGKWRGIRMYVSKRGVSQNWWICIWSHSFKSKQDLWPCNVTGWCFHS